MLFELEGVSLTRGRAQILRGVSVELAEGASCIAGDSGSGKSTLLRLLNRLAEPDAGTIAYRGRPLRSLDVLELRREVALVPQLPALLPGTVAENVAFGPSLVGREVEAGPLLELAGLPAEFAGRDGDRLSVGEQQRVMLARALALEPRVLLLDEPTSALDARARDRIEETLLDLRARLGLSLVLVTHDLAQAERLADRVIRLEHGRVIGSGEDGVVACAGGRGMRSPSDVTFVQVAATLGLVAVAVVVSLWQRMRLERDIAIAVARSFLQLTAVGFVIALVFEGDSLLLVVALIAVMAVFGAFTARARAPLVPHAFVPLLIALGLAGTATLVLLVVLGVFSPEPRYLVPLGGMVIGNSMTAAAVALGRLGEEVTASRREIEATLALGATATQAARPIVRRSLRSGVIPLIDSTKTTGVIFFPGIMVGLLVAGAAPLDAVRLQLIILYMLLGSVSIASVTAVVLAQRNFFTPAHQLREPVAVRSDDA